MTVIYVDADACPVKDEVYRVAQRYGLQVFVVCNSWLRAGALASRGEHLRSMGEITGGPRAFSPADRSRFLQALDVAVVKAKRSAPA